METTGRTPSAVVQLLHGHVGCDGGCLPRLLLLKFGYPVAVSRCACHLPSISWLRAASAAADAAEPWTIPDLSAALVLICLLLLQAQDQQQQEVVSAGKRYLCLCHTRVLCV
jgi:hypothetical protein